MPKLTLDDILTGPDELGILIDESSQTATTTVDDRTRSGFEEINAFFDEHGREPALSEAADIREKSLAKRLERIKADASLTAALKANDLHHLLDTSPADQADSFASTIPRSLDDVLDLIDLEDGEDDIFSLRHVSPASQRKEAEYVARRKPCADFEKFRPLFETASKELELGIRKTMEFRIEKEILPGHFFILNGLMAYVAEVGEPFLEHGKENARIRTIFSNGTEVNNLRWSLAAGLYRDKTGRRVSDPLPGVLFGGVPEPSDVGTGTIYVLRSLSQDPKIAQHKEILHKIGVTSSPVKQRIANAENDSTYLLAPVEIVATYELFNINSTKLENMLHRYFDAARADITINDRFGKPVQPREWFFITLSVIREFVKRLEDGSIRHSRYDFQTGRIVDLPS